MTGLGTSCGRAIMDKPIPIALRIILNNISLQLTLGLNKDGFTFATARQHRCKIDFAALASLPRETVSTPNPINERYSSSTAWWKRSGTILTN
jgi:hypothetical protein